MGVIDQTRFVERLRFFDGQRLFAADLQGLEAFNREMRWLHNQSLHQPGIGRGYVVTGEKGDRMVTVRPGYALDYQGRELIHTHPLEIQVPPVSSDEKGRSVFFDLTVSYQETDLEEVEFREGLCDTRGAIRLREAPVFCWVRLGIDETGNLRPEDPRFVKEIQQGQKIVLARVEVFNCRLQQAISINQRQSALPECGPYVACGTQEPTAWDNLVLDSTSTNQSDTFLFQAVIDTRAAGFKVTPCYSAQIIGPRLIKPGPLSNQDVLLVDLLRIQDPKPDKFSVLLLVSVFGGSIIDDDLDPAGGGGVQNSAESKMLDWLLQNWRVTWMGVEG